MPTKYELMTEWQYNAFQIKKCRAIGRNDDARTLEDENNELEKQIEVIKKEGK